ncbi:MAG: nickel pincer cofactor biosynthesis protein LarB [Nitrospirae bacterium]|nr:nickel pincer cofactor biosynthesis protein LarB [Nitrospirota bacterium]
MNPLQLKKILQQVRSNTLSPDEALEKLKHLPYENLGFARVDHHRHLRQGLPEVIYCEGKTVPQVKGIAENILKRGSDLIATRADLSIFQALKAMDGKAVYNGSGRVVTILHKKRTRKTGAVLVITAGTSDIPVAEEGRAVLEAFGNRVDSLYDVGVAGIHRLLDQKALLSKARVIIVAAGMDGALASVVGGLTDRPVIAVPTSVGYGASFGGISALLAMLNSCASGVAVMNIDNGFGAACLAHKINNL